MNNVLNILNRYFPCANKRLLMVTGAYGGGGDLFINSASQLPTTGIRFSEEDDGTLQFSNSNRSDLSVMHLALGVIPLAADSGLYLLEYPGALRRDLFWDAMQENMLGEILLVDSACPETFAEARAIRRYLREHQPILIAATNRQHPEAWELEEIRTALRLEAEEPLWSCEVTDSVSVKALLVQFLKTLPEDEWVAKALMEIASKPQG